MAEKKEWEIYLDDIMRDVGPAPPAEEPIQFEQLPFEQQRAQKAASMEEAMRDVMGQGPLPADPWVARGEPTTPSAAASMYQGDWTPQQVDRDIMDRRVAEIIEPFAQEAAAERARAAFYQDFVSTATQAFGGVTPVVQGRMVLLPSGDIVDMDEPEAMDYLTKLIQMRDQRVQQAGQQPPPAGAVR